jgi:hypothetical protein
VPVAVKIQNVVNRYRYPYPIMLLKIGFVYFVKGRFCNRCGLPILLRHGLPSGLAPERNLR